MKLILKPDSLRNIHEGALHEIRFGKAEGDYFITLCWLKSVCLELNKLGVDIELEQEERDLTVDED